jgi:hypothetical protein
MLYGWRITLTPEEYATSYVPSREPSSTTRIEVTKGFAFNLARTSGSDSTSLKAGIATKRLDSLMGKLYWK